LGFAFALMPHICGPLSPAPLSGTEAVISLIKMVDFLKIL